MDEYIVIQLNTIKHDQSNKNYTMSILFFTILNCHLKSNKNGLSNWAS